MDISKAGLVKLLLPKAPVILKILVYNWLRISPVSKIQDAQTEVVVAIIRSLMKVQKPFGVLQRGSMRDPGIKGKVQVAKVVIPAPSSHARDLVVEAIKLLGDGSEQFQLPDIKDVEAEWTGHDESASKDAPRPDLTEAEHYKRLMNGIDTDATILYMHGGAYSLMV